MNLHMKRECSAEAAVLRWRHCCCCATRLAHIATGCTSASPQVFNVCTSPIVQQAWDNGQTLAVHGLVYALSDGILQV